MQPAPNNTIKRFFSGLTEFAFVSRVGVADPPLVDYVSDLLTRFVNCDSIYRIRDLSGKRLEEVGRMLAEANERIGEARRDVHCHIGDFALFWAGLYPEALRQMQNEQSQDQFLDYCTQGKQAYYIASTIPGSSQKARSELLKRLSHEFDMCVYGLGEVRREWERRDEEGGNHPVLFN